MGDIFFWAAACAAAAVIGISKGGLPLIGILSVPILSLAISPLTAVGLLLPVHIVSDAFALYAYRKFFDKRVLAIILPGMFMGVMIGWATAHMLSDKTITLLVGLIGFIFAAQLVFLPSKQNPKARKPLVLPGLFWGTIAGVTSFVTHAGAPPYQVYTQPLGLNRRVFAGTAVISFAFVNLVKLGPYIALGQVSLSNVKISIMLMPVAGLFVFIATQIVKWLPEKRFFQVITYALLIISLKLIWNGFAN